MNGIDGQHVSERLQVLLTLGTGSRLGLTDEVPDQVKVAFSIREAFLFRVPERQPLHDELGSVFAHRCKKLFAGSQEGSHRGGRWQRQSDLGGRLGGIQVDLHSPARRVLRLRQDALLDGFEHTRKRDLNSSLTTEFCVQGFLTGGLLGTTTLGPGDTTDGDIIGIAFIAQGSQLQPKTCMLQALLNGDGALRRFFLNVATGQDVERFALIRAFSSLGGGIRFQRNRVAIGRPRHHTDEMPSFLEFDFIEFGQVGRALQAVRRPGFDLLGFSYWAVILRNDLHRKMVKATDLARVRVNLEHHVHFATVVRDQNLLPDEAGELVVGLILRNNRQVGLQYRQKNLVQRKLFLERPFVERDAPPALVGRDGWRPGFGLLDIVFFKVGK